MHLAVDGFGADQEKLTDEGLILRFLEEYPETLGMKKISLPQVHVYRGPVHEDWGISGFVLIAESHISIQFRNRIFRPLLHSRGNGLLRF